MANNTLASALADDTGWTRPAPFNILAAVDGALAAFLDAETASLAALDPALQLVAGTARQAVLAGGKRIRPTFAYWGWRGAVGQGPAVEPVLPALAALELLHAFALVHDDVMDASPVRRGMPTAHRALTAHHSALGLRGDPDTFGISAAILVGDLCLVWADKMIDLATPGQLAVRAARRRYDQMRVEAIAGQFLDLLGESSPDWSVERALFTARLKTASYTVTRPLQYGAALADGAVEGPLIQLYADYGRAVGEAFQLRDDLLGVYGDPATTGKPMGEDLARGKPTVLVELARTRVTNRQGGELEQLLRCGTPQDVPRFAALLRDTGAPTQVDQMIKDRVAYATSMLDDAPIDPATRQALTDLAAAAAWRQS